MPHSLFQTLPTEIICRVFEFADDFSVVSAFTQTAPIFNSVWREYPTSICRAVISRVLSNLTEAERLLDAHERAGVVSQSRQDHKQKSIIRTKFLLSNARCASAAADKWAGLCQEGGQDWRRFPQENDPCMRPSEIIRFKHAFYYVWTVGVMGTAPHLVDQASAFLDECSPRELCRLDELAVWARQYNDNDFGSLGLSFDDDVWMTAFDLVHKRWRMYLVGKPCPPMPERSPFNFYCFFDDTQRYLDFVPDNIQ